MNFSTLFRLGENLNLDKKTLINLRWIAIIGQLSAISIVYFYLKFYMNCLNIDPNTLIRKIDPLRREYDYIFLERLKSYEIPIHIYYHYLLGQFSYYLFDKNLLKNLLLQNPHNHRQT